MSDTPLLGLPLLEANQAQKHVTLNEALLLIDAALHLSVASRNASSPPEGAADGARHLVTAGAEGEWAGQAGKIALRIGGGWVFAVPRAGWRLWVEDEAKLLVSDGANWRDISAPPLLGVNATADAENRLAVASASTLFTHAGAGHRLKLNKKRPEETAALLCQTDFSGRAELGLSGDDDFHVKVSGDGGTWREAIVIDRMTGAVRMPETPPATLYAQSLAAQGPGFAAETYLAGSGIAVPRGRIRGGTRYRLVFDAGKTAAGVAAPVLRLRFGAQGSLADAVLAVLTFPAQTAAADDGRFSLDVTFRSAGSGAAAVAQAVAALQHRLAATGLSQSVTPVVRATSAGFDSSGGGVIGVSLHAGAAAAWSVSLVQASLENLA